MEQLLLFREAIFFDGAWKGAAVGFVGGLLSPIGGAGLNFIQNVGLGAAEGVITGGLSAAISGSNIGNGMLWGAVGGAAFAAITSPELKNLVKGKGFKGNNSVLNDFKSGMYTNDGGAWQQDALDYFGFEGKYNPLDKGPNYIQGNGSYNGYTDLNGQVYFGDSAFDSYDRLKAISIKENYHSTKLLNGGKFEKQDFSPIYAPEERLGFLHLYKSEGLIPNSGININSQIEFYQINSLYFGTKYKNWYDFIYKMPRRF